MTSPEQKPPQKQSSEPLSQVVDYAKSNKFEAIAYLLLFIGVIAYVFNTMVGGLIVGAVAGFYFGQPVVSAAKGTNAFVDREGIFKTFILGGFLLCLVISAPFLFLGMAVVAGILAITGQS